jgi:hypothetical protein
MTTQSADTAIDFCSFETNTPNRHAAATLLRAPNMFMARLQILYPEARIVDPLGGVGPDAEPDFLRMSLTRHGGFKRLAEKHPNQDGPRPIDAMGGGDKQFEMLRFLTHHPDAAVIDPKGGPDRTNQDFQ